MVLTKAFSRLKFGLIRSQLINVRHIMSSSPKKAKADELEKEDVGTDEESHKEEVTRIRESDVSITEYLGSHRGFTGLLKQRYSDFVVHEIGPDGEEIYLTNMVVPDVPEDEKMVNAPQLDTLIAIEKLAELTELAELKKGVVEIDVTEMDKDSRTNVHKSVSRQFSSFCTKTVDKDSKKLIVVSIGQQQVRGDNRGRWPYPGDFTHFTLYMENRGTIETINAIARAINYKQKGFEYAGSKDKRAIAVQRMSLFRTEPKKLMKVNDIYNNNPNPIAIGNFGFEKKPLRLGQLSGNVFDIVLREAKFEDKQHVEEAFTSLSTRGFINYFGTQRFGSGHVRTQEIGLAILRENWSEAVNLILSPTYRDRKARFGPSFNECMKMWQETKDASKVFRKFYWKSTNEGTLLKELSQNPKDFYGALMALPRNNRTMYLHAYQSLIWNRVASERIRDHGLKVLPGDLLLFEEVAASLEPDEPGSDRLAPVIADESNLEKATIFDVVLPLPGTKVMLPQNETGDKIKNLLDKDGLNLEQFATRAKTFMFFGAYRKLICRPKKLMWSLVAYADETERLVQTDLDKVLGIEHKENAGGDKQAIKLSVSLPSSSYATVFIRELLKQDLASVWLDAK